MAREIRTEILAWCDSHASEGDEQVPATVTRLITLTGSPVRQLDLCEPCDKLLVEGLSALVDSRGVRPDSQARARPIVTAVPRRPRSRTGGFPCPECGSDHSNTSSLEQHVRVRHQTTLCVLNGTAKLLCPVKGCRHGHVSSQGLLQHLRQGHGKTSQAERDSLMAAAVKAGPPKP